MTGHTTALALVVGVDGGATKSTLTVGLARNCPQDPVQGFCLSGPAANIHIRGVEVVARELHHTLAAGVRGLLESPGLREHSCTCPLGESCPLWPAGRAGTEAGGPPRAVIASLVACLSGIQSDTDAEALRRCLQQKVWSGAACARQRLCAHLLSNDGGTEVPDADLAGLLSLQPGAFLPPAHTLILNDTRVCITGQHPISEVGGAALSVCLVAGTGSNCTTLPWHLEPHEISDAARCHCDACDRDAACSQPLASKPASFQRVSAGGWGHLLADHGSGYACALLCLQNIFLALDHVPLQLDSYAPEAGPEELGNPAAAAVALGLMADHFQIPADVRASGTSAIQSWMVQNIYTAGSDSKSFIAGFALQVAHGAATLKDPFCRAHLHHAGWWLGRLLRSVIQRSLPGPGPELPCGVSVACIGSLFNAFEAGLGEGLLLGLRAGRQLVGIVMRVTCHQAKGEFAGALAASAFALELVLGPGGPGVPGRVPASILLTRRVPL
ncbi:hypothetical protein H696_02142 [Fonticula alba]|uniref:N-acetyl-D-glucosamine kinase n=1 Tax=Fonticula alba TaxID=691883 RepID=A0A058ZA97_FONAL|nr:hypothetical protein H696_02142 [Fonticula alba]KCV71190.1 hypothetical protein H696_02142 [Fonticula alba]|eukprot:XP_009494313.1 hypothetical protein H696_02142 [Fonticula alba]